MIMTEDGSVVPYNSNPNPVKKSSYQDDRNYDDQGSYQEKQGSYNDQGSYQEKQGGYN
jgi:hypothetical protein